jgi:hypothetical protein
MCPNINNKNVKDEIKMTKSRICTPDFWKSDFYYGLLEQLERGDRIERLKTLC